MKHLFTFFWNSHPLAFTGLNTETFINFFWHSADSVCYLPTTQSVFWTILPLGLSSLPWEHSMCLVFLLMSLSLFTLIYMFVCLSLLSCPVSYITKYLYLHISLPIQLGSLWNFILKIFGYQPFIPTCFIYFVYLKMNTIRHGVVQIIKKCLHLCQINMDLFIYKYMMESFVIIWPAHLAEVVILY